GRPLAGAARRDAAAAAGDRGPIRLVRERAALRPAPALRRVPAPPVLSGGPGGVLLPRFLLRGAAATLPQRRAHLLVLLRRPAAGAGGAGPPPRAWTRHHPH